MRATGTIENYGNQTLKVHDAVRALGLQHLTMMDADITNNALLALKDLLIESLHQTRDTSRFSLLTQIYIKLNDVMTLIGLSGEELFYEMGITVDIMESLKQATASDSLAPLQKFWALDGLVFPSLKTVFLSKLRYGWKRWEPCLQNMSLATGNAQPTP